MTMALSRTPLAILNEAMVKRRIIPTFEINANSNGSFGYTFTCKISCDGLVATGNANNKKEAKQLAAKEILKMMKIPFDESPENSLKRPLTMEDPSEDEVMCKQSRIVPNPNIVGALQNLCNEKYKEVPQFKIDGTGPPHMKVFTASCTVSTLFAHATGNTKKQAKNAAASKMLELINANVSQVSREPKFEKSQDPTQKLDPTNIQTKSDTEIPQVNLTNNRFVPSGQDRIHDKNSTPIPPVEKEKIHEIDNNEKTIKSVSSTDEKIIDKLVSPFDEKAKNNVTSVSPLEEKRNIQVVSPFDEKANNTNSTFPSNEKNIQVVSPFVEKADDKVKSPSETANNAKQVVEPKLSNSLEVKMQNVQNSPLMKYMKMKASSNKLLISTGHFKKTYSDEIRLTVLKKVILLLEQINTTVDITTDFVIESKKLFVELLKPLNLSYKCKQLPTRSSKFLMLVEISTNPDINEVGIGDSLHVAELNSIKQILQLMTKLL